MHVLKLCGDLLGEFKRYKYLGPVLHKNSSFKGQYDT